MNRIALSAAFLGMICFNWSCGSMHGGGGGGGAGSVKAAGGKPDVRVQFPENWKVQEGPQTVASSPDGVSLVVMRIDKKSPAEVLKNVPQSFGPVMRNVSLNNDVDETPVNGMKAEKFSGHGQRDDRVVRFTAMLFASKDGSSTDAVIAVAPETKYKQHMLEIDTALDSVKGAE